ncbi:MAG: ABC-F family ATP-binding cassette domain-containing protein [Clostridia bacterium]|nr:ABC-F family ATP-binding cassette domain-containing protein [Clostridia bacterium]
MIVLSANNLTKVYGTDVILKGVSFHVEKGERVGIVGTNGAGKTTLLRMLSGELPCDEGDFYVSQNISLGYLKQKDNFDRNGTVMGEVEKIFSSLSAMEKEIEELSQYVAENVSDERALDRLDQLQMEYQRKGGYSYRSQMIGILNSMSFKEDSYQKPIESLSGGERTRLALACLLMEKPDILLLDEPTNHLDIATLKWLEGYLKSYTGTVLIVSHDRYFLDQTVNRIFHIENHRLTSYRGGYSSYASERRKVREDQLRAYNNQQKEIKRQEDMIRRFKERGTEHLAKRAASREKRLDQIELLEKPEAEKGRMKIHFKENFKSGNDVIYAENLSKSFPKKELFKDVNLDIKRGEKICLVGANGIGKTTLLKMILDMTSPSSGKIKLGHNVDLGYYDQGQRLLNGSNTVLEELKESYRLYTDTEMRSILGRFLFRNEEVFTLVGDLSGGEKARLSLLKLMLSGANTLLMDEPTNHLDIESKEVFEDALLEFPGTAIIVSHDRYLLNRIPSRILELTEDGIKEYLGKYDYYMEKKGQPEEVREERQEKTSSKDERARNKEKEAQERRRAREIAKVEEEIQSLEEGIALLEEEMAKPQYMADHQKLTALSVKLKEAKDELDAKYDLWAQLQ